MCKASWYKKQLKIIWALRLWCNNDRFVGRCMGFILDKIGDKVAQKYLDEHKRIIKEHRQK